MTRSDSLRAAFILLLTALTYANSFHNGFVWDDASSLLSHEHVQDTSKLFQLFQEDQHVFGRGRGTFYRPLVSASFMLDYQAALRLQETGDAFRPVRDLDAFVFHLTNTLWHGLVALLLLGVLMRIGAPAFVRTTVPLIYAIHPLHTEAITYISGRADPMAAAFMLAGLLCALHDGPSLARFVRYGGTAVCAACAVISKESGAIFPVLLLIVSFGWTLNEPQGKRLRAFLHRLGPLVASALVLGAYAWVRARWLRFASDSVPLDTTLSGRLIETFQAFATYLVLLFKPAHLHMERTLNHATGWTAIMGIIALAFFLALFLYALYIRHGRLMIASSWFLITWVPISGLIPLNAPMAEHWMYVPMIGFFWTLAELLTTPVEDTALRPIGYTAIAVWAVFLLSASIARNPDWRDNESIYLATLRENPNTARVHFNLAVTYQDILHNPVGARRHYDSVLALAQERKRANGTAGTPEECFGSDELESHLSLGRIYAQSGDVEQALVHFAVLVGLGPDESNRALLAQACLGVGTCLQTLGRTEQAKPQFERAIELMPDWSDEIRKMMKQ